MKNKARFKILICSAFKKEYEHLKQNILKISISNRGDSFGIKNNSNDEIEIYFIEIGIGKTNAAVNVSFALASINPDIMIHIGCCGSLNDDVKTGTIFCPEEISEADVCGYIDSIKIPLKLNPGFFKSSPNLINLVKQNIYEFSDFKIKFDNILTGDFILLDYIVRDKLSALFNENRKDATANYSGFDMESYAVAAAAQKFNTQFLAVRICADNCRCLSRQFDFTGVRNKSVYSLKEFSRSIYDKSVDKNNFYKSLEVLNEFVLKLIRLLIDKND